METPIRYVSSIIYVSSTKKKTKLIPIKNKKFEIKLKRLSYYARDQPGWIKYSNWHKTIRKYKAAKSLIQSII